MYYFAYGSNMSLRRLGHRITSASFVSTALLGGHELRFHKPGVDRSGKCDAYYTGDPRSALWGVLFSISAGDKAELDAYEGLGFSYLEKWVEVTTPGGAMVSAVTYCAVQTTCGEPPYRWYRSHVLIGAREHGLPVCYRRSIRGVRAKRDHDASRHAREMAVHRAGQDGLA